MSDTLGSLRAEVVRWMRGDFADPAPSDDAASVNDAINDALDSIWGSMVQVQLSRFLGASGPVSFTLSAGQERVVLTTITDPIVAPTVNSVAGGAIAARTYAVSYTFVTESGSETNSSPVANQLIAVNNVASIPAPVEPATGAFGWNLYAGINNPALQNQQPLPFGVAYVEPVTGFQDYPINQQLPPTSNATGDNIAWIKHLEFRTSDQLLRKWRQHDVDSDVMSRMARTLANASEYQSYVWDLVNGNILEFRPSAGLTFTPRYFGVYKPRRLRYDQADIPYVNISGVHEFLKWKAMAALKLSIDEYLSSQGCDTKANMSRQEILLALSQENWAKDTKIVPHMW